MQNSKQTMKQRESQTFAGSTKSECIPSETSSGRLPDSPCTTLASNALERAARKQNRIFIQTGEPYVLKDWYLDILIEEAIREILFEEFTLRRTEEQLKMENERQSKKDTALTTATFIISAPSRKYKEVL